MKKFIKTNGIISEVTVDEAILEAIAQLPPERRPVFLAETSKEVVAYLAAQAELKPPAPTVVNMCQARLALLEFGYLDDVEAAMQTDAIPRTAKIYWGFSQLVRREDETVQLMQQLLSLSDAQLDELFIFAASK
jgi:hypothetical protein